MPTTQETLVKNGIKIVQISASYERKISDGQYGSMGGFFSMTADVEPVAEIDDQIDMLFAFVRDAAAKQLKPEFIRTKTAIAQATEHAVNVEIPTTQAVNAPAPVAHQTSAPSGTLQFDCIEMSAVVNAGKVRWIIKGGQFTKYGVTCWPETLAATGVNFNSSEVYKMTGWRATYILKDDGKPDKVIKLERIA